MDMKKWGPITTLVVILCALYGGVGGAVVLFGEGLTFEEYGNSLWKFAAAAGLTGIGRGLFGGDETTEASGEGGTRRSTTVRGGGRSGGV